MDAPCESFCELLSIVKSWLPLRSESANVSRDFWMPDQSCRVCYDCDSQFTLFNRRHHCRLCGRIFCGSCTANSVPAASCDLRSYYQDPWEKVRVCNYCYDQWEQGIAAPRNGIESPNLDHCMSPSTPSLAGTKSICTGDSSNATFCSVPLLIGSCKLTQQGSVLSPSQLSTMDERMDKQGLSESRGNGIVTDIEISSSHQHEFWANRIDDYEDEYGAYQSDFATNQFFHVNDYHGQVVVDAISTGGSNGVHPGGEVVTAQYFSCSLASHNFEPRSPSEGIPHLEIKEHECDTGEDGDAPSSLYVSEVIDAEPVDFENNGLLWLPPDPENENDEREQLLFDDDDEDGAAGEWGYLQTSNSFGSGEYRKSGEEHRKAMKSVVEGHFRALVAQLLQVENLPIGEDNDKDNWLEIVISLALEVATLLKPDTSTSGGMDPGGYVKVKCIASGKCCDSMVIKGVVCKKNVAHRRMSTKIDKARILILGGALEYQRVTNHLSSFDTLLQQEMDHLKMAVAKIAAHHPNVLLVEKSVSRFAQEYLLEKDISLVLNVKRPLLERVARCTGAQIVPSIDNLLSQKLGYCEAFHLERFIEDLSPVGTGGKKAVKTLMYFEGCPKPLGCTILLRGASADELKKVKHVVQYAVFAAYHLALETSFLADEGACLPELSLDSSITASLPGKQLGMERSILTVPGFNIASSKNSPGPQPGAEPQNFFSVPVEVAPVSDSSIPSFDLPDGTFQSAQATSSFMNSPRNTVYPSAATQLLVSGSCHQKLSRTTEMNKKTDLNEGKVLFLETTPLNGVPAIGNHLSNEGFRSNDGIKPNALEKDPANEQSGTVGIGLGKLSSEECGKDNSNGSGFLKEEQLPAKEELSQSLSDHQSILVSLSSRCVWKGTVCEMAHLFRIKYYGTFDKPLGRFLRDHLFDQGYKCGSCDMPSEAHVHCYTHRQGTLTISVKKLSEVLLPGEKEGKIWMWHRCLLCPRVNGFPPATQRIVMSDAAWGLSFGKFLELSFSNHAAASRVASCGHSLHRDCLRFYGFGNMVACFRYASIDVHSVYLPRPKLEFNHEREWIQKEKDEVVDQAELLFSEVLNALRQIADRKCSSVPQNGSTKTAEFRRHVVELEAILQQEKSDFEDALQKVLSKEVQEGDPAIDVLDINRLRRQLLFQSYMWDHRLVYAATLDKYNCHNGTSNLILENKEISVKAQIIETGSQPTGTIPKRLSANFESFLMDSEFCKSPELRGDTDGDILKDNLVKEQYNFLRGGSNRKDGEAKLSLDISISLPSIPLESGLTIRRALSDSEYPSMVNLSDTLDAKWTGDNLPVTDTINSATSVATDHVADYTIATTQMATSRKEELAEYLNNPKTVVPASPATFSKNQTSAEEPSSLLRMPFLNFYRLLNKNFLAGSQKLDTVVGYDPVYISSFRELELQSGARLLLPIGVNDTVVPVYDDEPSSIISYALMSPHYHHQMTDEWERIRDESDGMSLAYFSDTAKSQSFYSADESFDLQRGVSFAEDLISYMSATRSDPVSHTKAMHARVSFGDEGPHGKAKYSVTCYYAKQFEALRRVCCPSELDFVRSLSRCKKWGAQGGKSNVFFAKTLDDRFILKQVTKTELESFIKFAPEYFKYLSESISTRSPTCLAKILGIYQVTSKQLKGGKELRMDILVMENLLFQRNVSRLYDLKGSARSRYNADSSGSNKVLLDQNLIESMPTSPIFVGNKAKRLLERAVWNDTAFLASIDVMDYSLLVGVDQENQQLIVGIIDFMRQYTWDKHLETWVKASGILGGPKNASPTVISPKQYKKRFRKAMTTYFLMVPDQWTPPSIIPSLSQSDLVEDNTHTNRTSVE